MSYSTHTTSSQSIIARCAVITLSDTRTESTDTSGQLIQQLLTESHHTLSHYKILPDDPTLLKSELEALLSHPDIDAILLNGGTGISPRDQTIPILEQLIQIPLPGFGELFRTLSYHQIQSGAMLSRALAGIANHKPLFSMPGSTKAVELAMTKLILPELKHLLSELKK